MVVGIPCINCCTDFCYLLSLGMADINSTISNHSLCKGNGYYVSFPQMLIYFKAPTLCWGYFYFRYLSIQTSVMKKSIFLLLAGLLVFNQLPATSISLTVPTEEPGKEVIRKAAEEFRALSKKEKKYKLKQAKKTLREYKKAKKAGAEPDTNTILLAILALLLPPLAVYLHQGVTNNKFWITTLLFLLGILGAFTIGWYLILASIVYALIVILGNN